MKPVKCELFNDHFQNEEWKDIPGYEGLYQASNTGLIKSLDREITQVGHKKNPYTRKMRGQILRPGPQNSGYEIVWLSKNGKMKAFTVHRLVMLTFTKNSDSSLEVNHIDGNKQNNKLDNLEWCTRGVNILHSYKTQKRKPKGIPVKCVELNLIFRSSAEASRMMGISAACIMRSATGTHRAGGYKWERT